MKIFPPADVFSPKQWLSIIGADLSACILWASHFIFEYNACIKIGLELYILAICYLGCVLGGLFALKIIPKMNYYFAFLLFLSLDIMSLIVLITVENPIIVIITLFGAGFFGSSFTGLIFIQFSYALPDPKFNGRANCGGYFVINLLIVFMIVINSNLPLMNIIFLIAIFTIIIISTLIGKSDVNLPPQSSLRITKYIFDKKNIAEIFIAFFWGFFLTIPFYSTFLIYEGIILQEFFNTFVLILFITFVISLFIAGQIYDILGRKVGMLLGLGIQALSFLLIVIINDEYYLDYIFPIVLGIGTTFFLTSIPLIFVEITPKKLIRDKMSLAYIFMGLGMIFAVVIAELLKNEFLKGFSYLVVYLLFMFLIAAIFISQIKETLPSKQELEWQGEMQYLFIYFKSGVTIYNQDLTKLGKKTYYREDSEILLGGALVAVSSIFNEILRERKIIKIIKQENFTIHIEEGKHVIMALIALHEIKKIRSKMQEFLDDFEDFFEDALVKGIAETQLFMPTTKIVQKHFFNYW
ncbi:MFS transporter [Promethearchaeum syntrophicum]|uniref:MFS transporter n=1 Tax=Promethearchaeum syntrophicum TaxID=2594042 RepID=A0A5B9D5I9_9ARCH|nr:MFS transporter [Candidatus Prometheoarchaeum syntrophicum]QEE14344.1 Major Facilitator Superfamily protein [Candidatus Prometheoarchaeum syntrophicum]